MSRSWAPSGKALAFDEIRKTFKEVVLGCLRGEPTAGYCGFDGPTLASMASNPRAEQVAATPKKKPGPRAFVPFCYI